MKILLLFLLIFSSNSLACSCFIPKHPSKSDYLENLSDSDAVFTATITDVSPTDINLPGDSETFIVTVRTGEIFKGNISPRQSFFTGDTCGAINFTPGKTYLIYSFADETGNLHVAGCSYTKEFKAKSREHKILRKASNYAIKGTSVETLDSSELSSGASVPYLGC
jgi:hypothetical protein